MIKPALPGSLVANTFVFGVILIALRIFPRLADMWIQTSYPEKLLTVEFVNGIIGSFIIALVLSLML
jgi:hypothetical protein